MATSEVIKAWHTVFTTINNDSKEDAVPFSDTEYYAQQIHNLTNEQDLGAAEQLAMDIYAYALDVDPNWSGLGDCACGCEGDYTDHSMRLGERGIF
jgi:hemoglobin-like flavoprotein